MAKKTLTTALKGMHVESWELRESSEGVRKVYVRYAADIKEPANDDAENANEKETANG